MRHHNWIETGMNCAKTISSEGSGVTSVICKSGTLYAGLYDGSIKSFDSYSGSLLKELKGHRLSVWALAIDPTNNKLYSGCSDEIINV